MEGGYYYCNIYLRILLFFAVSIPNIVDIILSILSYKEECKKYYIIRFVTQGINFIFIIFGINYLIYAPRREKDRIILDGIGFLLLFIGSACAYLPMEITSLVYFIINFDLLIYLGKIGYYVHLIFVGQIILSIISVWIYSCFVNYNYNKKSGNFNEIKENDDILLD